MVYPELDLGALEAETHFDAVELRAFHEQFQSLSTHAPGGGIPGEVFRKGLGMERGGGALRRVCVCV
jgi:hypothetical protein